MIAVTAGFTALWLVESFYPSKLSNNQSAVDPAPIWKEQCPIGEYFSKSYAFAYGLTVYICFGIFCVYFLTAISEILRNF